MIWTLLGFAVVAVASYALGRAHGKEQREALPARTVAVLSTPHELDTLLTPEEDARVEAILAHIQGDLQQTWRGQKEFYSYINERHLLPRVEKAILERLADSGWSATFREAAFTIRPLQAEPVVEAVKL